MKTFVAIDIQTANHNKSSICAIGLVVVEDGVITDRIYRLVRPMPNFYSSWAVQMHGITNEDTANEPNFVDVWEGLEHIIRDNVLVAHNVDFVEGSLVAAHKIYIMDYPRYRFFCTIRSSRSQYPAATDHSLREAAARAGYYLDATNNALSNAEASAAIAMTLADDSPIKKHSTITMRAIAATSDTKPKAREAYDKKFIANLKKKIK